MTIHGPKVRDEDSSTKKKCRQNIEPEVPYHDEFEAEVMGSLYEICDKNTEI